MLNFSIYSQYIATVTEHLLRLKPLYCLCVSLQEPVLSKEQPAFQYSSHVSLQAPSGHMWWIGTFLLQLHMCYIFCCSVCYRWSKHLAFLSFSHQHSIHLFYGLCCYYTAVWNIVFSHSVLYLFLGARSVSKGLTAHTLTSAFLLSPWRATKTTKRPPLATHSNLRVATSHLRNPGQAVRCWVV